MKVEPFAGKSLMAVTMPPAHLTIYEGSVRSSKTWTSLIDWLRFIRDAPPGNLLMTGRTERTIIQNLLEPLQAMLGSGRVKINRGNGVATILGREVLIIGANNESARTKIQGLTLVGAYVDEASTLPESYFNMLYSRLSQDGARMWATSNPEGPAHWLKTSWLDRASVWVDREGMIHRQTPTEADDGPIDLNRFTFALEDNPHLSADYVKRIKTSYKGLWYRRYVQGEWCVAEGAIYEMWDPETHVVAAADIPLMDRVLSLGVDYGTTNAQAGLLIGLAQGKLWVLDEWAPPSGTDAEYSASLTHWFSTRQPAAWRTPEWVFVDPAGASFKMQIRRDGLNNSRNASNAVIYGIRTVASLLATGHLKVSSSCQNLIKEIPGYTWDKKATEKGLDAPNKAAGNDHFCDALRYGVYSTRRLWLSTIPMLAPSDESDLEEAA